MPEQSAQESLAADATDFRSSIGNKLARWPCGGIRKGSIAARLIRAVGVVDAALLAPDEVEGAGSPPGSPAPCAPLDKRPDYDQNYD
jgi:hypothetical protein